MEAPAFLILRAIVGIWCAVAHVFKRPEKEPEMRARAPSGFPLPLFEPPQPELEMMAADFEDHLDGLEDAIFEIEETLAEMDVDEKFAAAGESLVAECRIRLAECGSALGAAERAIAERRRGGLRRGRTRPGGSRTPHVGHGGSGVRRRKGIFRARRERARRRTVAVFVRNRETEDSRGGASTRFRGAVLPGNRGAEVGSVRESRELRVGGGDVANDGRERQRRRESEFPRRGRRSWALSVVTAGRLARPAARHPCSRAGWRTWRRSLSG